MACSGDLTPFCCAWPPLLAAVTWPAADYSRHSPNTAAVAVPVPQPRPADVGQSGHAGSHSRYCEGCRCPDCKAAHRRYLAAWRAGRLQRRVDTGPVQAHLTRLVDSGLLLAYIADEAAVPRSTARRVWHGAARTSPETAARLLTVRPLDVDAHLPRHVRLADTARPGRRATPPSTARGLADLTAGSARDTAALLGVSPRTVGRWRSKHRTREWEATG